MVTTFLLKRLGAEIAFVGFVLPQMPLPFLLPLLAVEGEVTVSTHVQAVLDVVGGAGIYQQLYSVLILVCGHMSLVNGGNLYKQE